MMEEDKLQEIVDICGNSLLLEDRFLTGCNIINRSDNWSIGILSIMNERFYQFIILRGLLAKGYNASIEKETYDLILKENNAILAVGEIKLWMSSTGREELPLIRKDIHKLKNSNYSAFLLILTATPNKIKYEEYKNYLISDIEELGGVKLKEFYFDTQYSIENNILKDTGRFSVLGFLIK